MTQSISVATPALPLRSGFQEVARKLVLHRLKHLHTGQLIIIDGAERFVFGSVHGLERSSQGSDEWSAEMHVHDRSCYADIMVNGSIGAAESFMTGDWTSPDLTALVRIMVRNMDVLDQLEGGLATLSRAAMKLMHRFNRNTEKGSRRNIAAHYDLGNDLFEHFLDPGMMYSAAIFPHDTATLEQASQHKLALICAKLDLQPEDHVIEIGSGWGGFAVYAAQHYGCRVTTTTISENQYTMARKRIDEAGLSQRITLLKQDYRKLEGKYDKLVSIEMIEAVGWQYYPVFFQTCARLLKPDGLMLLQAITIPDQRYDKARRSVDFIQRYIFPGSCIPSIQALNDAAAQSSDLRLVQLDDYAEHYARTLAAWRDNFLRGEDSISGLGYDETFRRMWQFYLSYCEGGFRERSIGVAHLLYAGTTCRSEPAHRH